MCVLPLLSLVPYTGVLKKLGRSRWLQYLVDIKNILQAQLAVRFKRGYLPSLFAHYTVNSACNLRCPYCYVSQPEIFPQGFSQVGLPLERAKRVLQTLRKECIMLRFQGGEPLLYPDIVELVGYAKRVARFWNVSMITNGLMLMKDLRKCTRLLENLDLLTISIDQTRLNEYTEQMEQLLYFLPKLRRWCQKYDVSLTCNYTATWEELAQPETIDATIQKLRPYFETFYIMPVRQAGKTPLPFLKNSLKLNGKYSLGRCAGPEYPEKENVAWYRAHCDPKLKIKVDAEGGLIYPCENYATSIGSLEYHTVKELWTAQGIKYPNENCLGCGKQRFRSYAFKHVSRLVTIVRNVRNSKRW